MYIEYATMVVKLNYFFVCDLVQYICCSVNNRVFAYLSLF